jgi:hypothetical protein
MKNSRARYRRIIAVTTAAFVTTVGFLAVSPAAPANAVPVRCTPWAEEAMSDGGAPGLFPAIYSRACLEYNAEGRYYGRVYVRAALRPDVNDLMVADVLKVNARVELHYCDGGGITANGYFDNPPSKAETAELAISTNSVGPSIRGYRVNYKVKSVYARYDGYGSAGGGTGAMSAC